MDKITEKLSYQGDPRSVSLIYSMVRMFLKESRYTSGKEIAPILSLKSFTGYLSSRIKLLKIFLIVLMACRILRESRSLWSSIEKN